MPPSGEIERQAGVGRRPVRQHDLKSSGGDMLRGRWLAEKSKPCAGQRCLQHQAGFVEREGAGRIDQQGLAALLEFPAVEFSRAHPGPDALMPHEVGRRHGPFPPDEIGGCSATTTDRIVGRIQSYIRLGLDEGAVLLTGGEGRPDGLARGWFLRPTVFTHVTNQMRIAREEIFGPVLCVIPYRDEAEAIAIANDTSYGLQSYVLSPDIDHAKRVAGQLQAGRVVINGAPHEPLAPFGGFKQSGIGREYGAFGLDAFLEPRVILS
jgi:hypothetical protein